MRMHDMPQPGEKFGRWTVICDGEKRKRGDRLRPTMRCLCDCGVERDVFESDLRNGRSVSCGCFAKEKRIEANTKHGLWKHPIYRAWYGMIARCCSKSHKSYDDYGGRGIVICDEWMKFETFYNDMKDQWSDGLSIERIDTNGNYCKENCKWIPLNEQSRNRRNTVKILHGDKEYILEDMYTIFGIPQTTFQYLIKNGMSVDDIINSKRRK